LKEIFIIFLLSCFSAFILNASEITLSEKEKIWIEKHPLITLGADSTWEPFVVDNNGIITGYDKDVLNLINKRTGANFQLNTGKWEEILIKAHNKKIDGLSTSAVHEERAKDFLFSDTYVNTQKYLITLNDNPKNINSIDDLVGKRIAYQKNNLFDQKLASQYKNSIIVPLKTIEDILQNLITGKIDVVLGNHEVFSMAMKKKLPYLKIVDKVENSKLDLVFSLRKDYPEAISILNKGLKAISVEEKNALDNKWFLYSQDLKENKSNLNLTKEEIEYLENKKVLKLPTIETLPPFSFTENGKAKGYSIDYMELVGKYLDIKIEFINNKTWDEYLQMLKDKKIDLIPYVAITKERQEYLTFTNFNHITYNTGIAVHRNSKISSMEELKDKVIAVTKNSFIETYLKTNFPELSLVLASSTAESVEFLSLGKADVAIGNLPSLNYFIQKDWLSNIKTITIDDFGTSLKTNLPMAVSKDNQILKSILEKVNVSISHNEIAALKQKWMNVSSLDYSNNELNSIEFNYLKDKKKIKMCVLPNWLPFEQIDERGNHKGIGADIMRIISKYIDTPIELVPTNKWLESLENLRNKKCDILPVAMDVPSRRDAMNFTKPYVSEPFVIATKIDKLFIKDSSSLANKKIGIVKSYAFIDVLKQRNPLIQIVDVSSTKEGLERVSSGELFGYIDTMPTIGYGIQKYAMFDLKIAGKLEFNIELSIASRNDEPLLNTIMQKALDSISEEEKRTIVGKWIDIKVAQVFDYTVLWQISSLFLFIVLAVLYKNRAVILINRELVKAKNEIEDQQKMVDKYVLILRTDTRGIITDVNEAYCKVTGYSQEELIGTKHNIMQNPLMKDSIFDEMWNTISSNKTWSGEITNLKKDKTVIFFNMYIEPIFKDSIKIGYRSISEDITDKKRIEELSITDKLTGLYNRLKLDEMMLIKIEEFKRYKVDFSVILIDVDDFKKVNDTYGHDIGDYILKSIASILKENIRISDVLGRWGGEEFIIICSNTNLKNTVVLAENLRKKISKIPFDKVGKKTVSLGVSQFTQDDTINSIFKKADDALYQSKASGKNKVSFL
jgi:diguanylate cyclase (GGDEF)-like protein/PAS domain S-box-containing protein